jgi:ligand-binding SRPBCC domain-containing protein
MSPTSEPVTIDRVRGGSYRLSCQLVVPRPLEEVFAFFSDARNLEELTPPWLRFRVVTPPPITMARGALIAYRLRVHGVPVRWTSTIDVWDPPRRFVDRQQRGPYRLWEHEHTFEPAGDGTLVGDRVDFAARGGRVAGWIVARDLRKIFGYRHARLTDIFA